MRVDKMLDKLCLVKTRSKAKKACDKSLVKINDQTAKASKKVEAGDVIEFNLYGFKNIIKLEKLPQGNVSKKKAAEYYSIISRDKVDI